MGAEVRAGDTTVGAGTLLRTLGLGDQADVARTPVITYGSNENVDALSRKFVTSNFGRPAVVPVVKATLHDYDAAWSPHFIFNGALPATITPSQGTSASVWVTWLDAAELAQMNVTEGVGSLPWGRVVAAGRWARQTTVLRRRTMTRLRLLLAVPFAVTALVLRSIPAPALAAPSVTFASTGGGSAHWGADHSTIVLTVGTKANANQGGAYSIAQLHGFPSTLPSQTPTFNSESYGAGFAALRDRDDERDRVRLPDQPGTAIPASRLRAAGRFRPVHDLGPGPRAAR